MEQPILETERLLLRPFVDADAPRVAELAGDRAVSDTTLRIPYPYDEVLALEWIRTHKAIRDKGHALFYAIELKESGEMAGSNGLETYFEHDRAEIGYWIGKGFWGRGYATEASSILIEYAFNVMRLHKVSAHTFARNSASGRVLEKLGLKREGHLKDHIKNNGKWEDIIEYGILEDEYRLLNSDLQRSG